MSTAAPTPTPTRGRRITATVLVAIASLLAFLAIFAIWANRQLLSTDNWTQTSSRLLENPTIRNQVGDYLVDQLYANVDVAGQIRAALPPRLQPLAAPAAGGLRSLADTQIKRFLARPRAQQAWENSNRQAHRLLLQVLNGGGANVSTENGRVVLDLKNLLRESQEQLGVGGRLAKVLPRQAAQLEVLRSDQLSAAQTGFRVLKSLPIVLLALSLALFGVAVWIAPGWRRRAVRAYGFGFIAAGLGALAAAKLIGDEVVSSLATTEAQAPAIHDTWVIATSLLRQAAVAAVGYGAVMVIGAWLAGPTGWAVAVRRFLAPYLREPAIAYGALAAILAAVLLWWQPTPATHNPVTALLLAALVTFGVEGLRRQAAREFPGSDRREAGRRRRERIKGAFTGARERTGAGAQAVVRQAVTTAGTATEGPPARTGNGHGASAPDDERLERLERLARLRDAGTLDEAEFQAEKSRVLADRAAAAP
jgi:hypothetical protein